MAGHSTYHVNVIKLLNNTGFTLRILVAGERCNVTGESISKEAPHLHQK